VRLRKLTRPGGQAAGTAGVTLRKASQASRRLAAAVANMRCMKTLKIFCFMLACLMFASAAQAQAGDWRAVQQLAPGSRISVKIRFHVLCDFEGATDAVLVCEPVRRPTLMGPGEFRFDRKRVREVRLEHSDDANTAVGAAVGAGVGATVGASLSPRSLTSGGSALLLGGIGGIAGGFFGRDFPILHGKIIYKR